MKTDTSSVMEYPFLCKSYLGLTQKVAKPLFGAASAAVSAC